MDAEPFGELAECGRVAGPEHLDRIAVARLNVGCSTAGARRANHSLTRAGLCVVEARAAALP